MTKTHAVLLSSVLSLAFAAPLVAATEGTTTKDPTQMQQGDVQHTKVKGKITSLEQNDDAVTVELKTEAGESKTFEVGYGTFEQSKVDVADLKKGDSVTIYTRDNGLTDIADVYWVEKTK